MSRLLRAMRKFFLLCDHKWFHASNVMTWDGPKEVLMCDKCKKIKLRDWSRGDD